MKKLLKHLGILLIVFLMLVGCSTKETKPVDDTPIKQPDEVKPDDSKENVKSKVLRDMMKEKSYTMKIKQHTSMENFEMESIVLTAFNDGDLYSKTEAAGMTIEFLLKDKKSYLIMDDSKTIIQSDIKDDDETKPIDDTIFSDDIKYVGKGKELFLGKETAFEEYALEDASLKYYFDQEKLLGILMVLDVKNDAAEPGKVDDISRATITVEVLSYEKGVDLTLFELPKDYTMINN